MNELATLAKAINEAHRAVRRSNEESVSFALTAGVLLIEAKEQVEHGAWLPWLAAHFDSSRRTAQLYMRLARNREKAQAVAHFGVAGVQLELARLASKPPREILRDQLALPDERDVADYLRTEPAFDRVMRAYNADDQREPSPTRPAPSEEQHWHQEMMFVLSDVNPFNEWRRLIKALDGLHHGRWRLEDVSLGEAKTALPVIDGALAKLTALRDSLAPA